MTSAMTSCSDWLNSTPADTKVEPFRLRLWSQKKTGPKSEMTHCVHKKNKARDIFSIILDKTYEI